MTERPYKSGSLRSCLLCRQPEDIKIGVIKMAKNHTFIEIIEWLKDRGIDATWNQVRYYLAKSGAKKRRTPIQPRHAYKDKLNAYIDSLLDSNAKTFTIRTLNLRGGSWTPVTKRLNADGLIEPIRTYTPICWRVLASKDEIIEWHHRELQTIAEKEEHKPTSTSVSD